MSYLQPKGIHKNLGMPKLNDYEKSLLEECLPILTQHIKQGEAFAAAKI